MRNDSEHTIPEDIRNIFHASSMAFLIMTAKDLRIIDANESLLHMLGLSADDIIGKQFWQLGLLEETQIKQKLRSVLSENERSLTFETPMLLKNGMIKHAVLYIESIFVGKTPCLFAMFHDVTSAKELEQNLGLMRERYVMAVRAANLGVWDWDIANDKVVWDDQMYETFGFNSEDIIDLKNDYIDSIHPEDISKHLADIKHTLGGSETFHSEFRVIRPDGTVRYISSVGQVISDKNGKPMRMIGINTDMTEKKQLEAEIYSSQKQLTDLFEKSAAIQVLVSLETGRIVRANAAAIAFYGYPQNGLIGKCICELNGMTFTQLQKRLKLYYSQSRTFFETKHTVANGSVRDIQVFNVPLVIEGQKVINFIIHDITEKKNAERALIESENRFRLFVENAPDGIFVQIDYKFAYANRRTLEIFGAKTEKELIGKYIPGFFSGEYEEKVKTRIKIINQEKRAVPLKEEQIVKLDGTVLDVEISAVPIFYNGSHGALVYLRDITPRKKLQEEKLEMEMQLRQKQKLESIGTLAGGVAHEINNPINGIINYAQLILDIPSLNGKISEYSKEIIYEGQRIAEIVKNLLSFSHHGRQAFVPVQVSDIINQTLSLTRAILRHDQIVLEINIAQELPVLNCRSQQIQQVLMNLITNARDALNAKYKGYNENKKIILTASDFLKHGSRWVRVTVEDHGSGIPDDIMEKMFDPFFTTKPREKGTGLGLSISHGIVKDHHGNLYFETEYGEYSRAVLELPSDNEDQKPREDKIVDKDFGR